jgi:hypothetical protein
MSHTARFQPVLKITDINTLKIVAQRLGWTEPRLSYGDLYTLEVSTDKSSYRYWVNFNLHTGEITFDSDWRSVIQPQLDRLTLQEIGTAQAIAQLRAHNYEYTEERTADGRTVLRVEQREAAAYV